MCSLCSADFVGLSNGPEFFATFDFNCSLISVRVPNSNVSEHSVVGLLFCSTGASVDGRILFVPGAGYIVL